MLGVGGVGAGVVGEGVTVVGREAICVGTEDKPVKEDVPPGRYWPGDEAMRTVAAATVPALDGMVLDCGPIGVIAAGVTGGWGIWVTPVAGVGVSVVVGAAAAAGVVADDAA